MKIKQIINNALIIASVFIVGNSLFFKIGNTNNNKISLLLNAIEKNYVDSIDMNSLIESSIEKTLKNLDPHSIYMNAKQVQSSMEMMQGSFEGIGIEFAIQKDTIVIINTIPNGPSEKVRQNAGERIIAIEGENVAGIGIKNEDVIKKLRGERGTAVTITTHPKFRKNNKIVKIIRDKIPLKSLEAAYEIAPQIGYIKLNRFAETTHREFRNKLEFLLEKNKIKSLILDLRNNSGGYLDQAVKILNEFFNQNKLLVYTKGQFRPEYKYFSDKNGIYKNGDIYILIDEGSASASEIIAGAIQDHNRGLIIGSRSFGKGLVQEQISLNDGSLIRLTVSRYYTPSGRCIQKPYVEEDEEEYFYGKNKDVDSLRVFNTENGDLVYGGGGIEPDYKIEQNEKIPMAVMYLYSSNFFNDLVFDFVDYNRHNIKQKNYNEWKISNTVLHSMYTDIVTWVKLEFDSDSEIINQIKTNQENIYIRIQALIIRQVWGWEERQMFLNEKDNIIISSLSLIKK